MNKSEAFWDKASKNYDKTEERFKHIHETTREKTQKYLKATDIVLDYGCGTGTKSCELAHLVKEIQGIDISSNMIEIAKGKANKLEIDNANFYQTAIFDDRFKVRSFDVILAFNMLHTVPKPRSVVRRIDELLKPGGLFISVTPCLQERMSFLVSLQIYLVRILSKVKLIPIPIRRLESADLDHLIKFGNFEAIEAEKIYSGASSYFIASKTTQKTNQI
ncbi:MAG: hypothetical protein Pars2KO_10500 [Parasphingorhabdus sp.]